MNKLIASIFICTSLSFAQGITVIQGTDQVSNSRVPINNNFAYLNSKQLTGIGTPTAPCSATSNLGFIYVNGTAGAAFDSLYVCAEPSPGTYAWEGPYGSGSSNWLTIQNAPFIDVRRFNFSQSPGGLVSPGSVTVNMAPCPFGVNGTDVAHWYYLQGGTGTAEPVLGTGGTCTSGASSGTITFTAANSHSGAWTIGSAAFGLQEAVNSGAQVEMPAGSSTTHAPVTTPVNQLINGSSLDSTSISVASDFPLTANGVFIGPAGVHDHCSEFSNFNLGFTQPDSTNIATYTHWPAAFYLVNCARSIIENVRVTAAWQAINLTQDSGGAIISNFQYSQFDRGIWIDGAFDSDYIINGTRNWPYGLTANQQTVFFANATSIYTARADDLEVDNFLSDAAHGIVAVLGTMSGFEGPTTGAYTNIWLDSNADVQIGGGAQVRIENFNLSYAIEGGKTWLAVTGTSSAQVTNAIFTPGVVNGGTAPIVSVDSTSLLQIDNSWLSTLAEDVTTIASSGELLANNNSFHRYAAFSYAQPTINILAGRATLTGNRADDLNGGETGTFINVAADNWHQIRANSAPGWGVSFPFFAGTGGGGLVVGTYEYDASNLIGGTNGVECIQYVCTGLGSPQGVVFKPVGTIYLRQFGSPGQAAYINDSGGLTGWTALGGSGTGTVTSVTVAGTTNQITATGTCAGTTVISCTLSLPSNVVLPGTVNGLTITTTSGVLTIASARTLTVNNSLTFQGTDNVVITTPSTNATMARTDTGQTFTGTQIFSSPISGSVTGSSASTVESFTVGTGGVTINTLAILDGSNPEKIIAATGTGGYGIAQATVAATGTVNIARTGQFACVTDTGGATAGDFVIPGTATVIDCKDSGTNTSSMIPITTRIIGIFLTSATAGNTAMVDLLPNHYGTQVSGTGSVGSCTVTGGGTATLGITVTASTSVCPLTLSANATVVNITGGASAGDSISFAITQGSSVYTMVAPSNFAPWPGPFAVINIVTNFTCWNQDGTHWTCGAATSGSGYGQLSVTSAPGTTPSGYGFCWFDTTDLDNECKNSAGSIFAGFLKGADVNPVTGLLANVNSNVGLFTNATVTADAKGRITAISSGTGGGGSVFTGSTATNPAFSATPTFSLADISVKSPLRVEPSVMTANVTAVTFTNTSAGAKFSIAWTQAASGGPFTVTYGGSTNNTCQISPTASIITVQEFEIGQDGTTVKGTGCTSNESVSRGVTTTAPVTPLSGAYACWFDSTDLDSECKNSAGSIFAGFIKGVDANPVTGQVTNLSHVSNNSLAHSGIAATAVTPGSCTNCNLTIQADGTVTAQTNGSGGGGTGNAANEVSVTFSATPTFTCGTASAGTATHFTVAALTANISSSTLATCTPGQPIGFHFVQDATGGRTVAMPTNWDAVTVDPTASTATDAIYWYDGTNGRLSSINGKATPFILELAPERAAPTGSVACPSGNGAFWFDSTGHRLTWCSNGGSALGAASLTGTETLTNKSLTSPTLTGSPITPTPTAGDNSTLVADTAFVTTAIANAVAASNPATSVLAASIGSSLTGTYSNGVSGIGATFTVTATGAFTLDGTSIGTIGQRVLLKDQSSAFQNGIYTATIVGTTGVSPVFTRALDYDQSSDINNTGAVFVQTGTVNILTSWLITSTVTTVGTDALNYSQSSSNPSNIVTAASNAAAAKQSPVAGGANKSLVYIDHPHVMDIPAANCNNATAGSGWSLPASASPASTCRAGTNNLGGVLQFADANNAQFDLEIPGDADLTTGNYPYIKLFFTDGANTSGTEIFQAQVSCYVSDFSATDDVAFATAQVFTTRTATAANRSGSENLQFNSTSMSGCVAGASMIVKITRNTDTAASVVNVSKASITIPRLLTVQAN